MNFLIGLRKIRVNIRGWILIFGTVVAFSLGISFPPIQQDPTYHQFADTRTFFFIPNFFNVVSNFPFLIIGFMGLFIRRGENHRNYGEEGEWFRGSIFGGLVLLFLGRLTTTYFRITLL